MEGISDTEVRRGRGLYFFGIIMSTIVVILIQIFTLIQSTCTEGCQILMIVMMIIEKLFIAETIHVIKVINLSTRMTYKDVRLMYIIKTFSAILDVCWAIFSQHTDIFIILSLTELGLDFITMIIITRIPY